MFDQVPVLDVLLYSTAAALFAGLGALPFVGGRTPHRIWLVAANAVAGGMMLGSAHLLTVHGVETNALRTTLGVALGVGYSSFIRAFASIDDLQDEQASAAIRQSPAFGYMVFLQGCLHSAAEGISIGVAMVVSRPLGIFLASMLAIHNVAEGMVLTDILRTQGVLPRRAAALAVSAKLTQPLLALVVFALAPVLAPFLPGALGFAAGSLSFLVLTELLPQAYRRSGHVFIATTVSICAAAVVLLEGLLLG